MSTKTKSKKQTDNDAFDDDDALYGDKQINTLKSDLIKHMEDHINLNERRTANLKKLVEFIANMPNDHELLQIICDDFRSCYELGRDVRCDICDKLRVPDVNLVNTEHQAGLIHETVITPTLVLLSLSEVGGLGHDYRYVEWLRRWYLSVDWQPFECYHTQEC